MLFLCSISLNVYTHFIFLHKVHIKRKETKDFVGNLETQGIHLQSRVWGETVLERMGMDASAVTHGMTG